MPQQADLRLPLHVRLRDDLERRIRAGEWNPETPLPAETELAESYNVSIGTMRRVVGELVADGLLCRRQGRGTFVRRADFASSMFRFFRMKGSTDAIPAGRILSRVVTEPPPEVAQALDAHGLALYLQRLRLWDTTPFLAEDIWLALPALQPLADVSLEMIGDLLYPAYESLAGVVIGSASEELSVTAADAELAHTLGCSAGAPLVRIERRARTHAGDVVEFRITHGQASNFRYRVEIN